MLEEYSFEIKIGVSGGGQQDMTKALGHSGLEKGCFGGFSIAE